ncbi:flagellin [Acuticoccus sp.]|uniref:flagellin n=1 Tax=Acuticoccus sp. TaxID=1904378 RepID=UPI003B516AC1
MREVTDANETVGIGVSRVENQADFMDKLAAVKAKAAAELVDVNLEEEAAQKDALVVRQQLAIEVLSIANSSYATILRLFD